MALVWLLVEKTSIAFESRKSTELAHKRLIHTSYSGNLNTQLSMHCLVSLVSIYNHISML